MFNKSSGQSNGRGKNVDGILHGSKHRVINEAPSGQRQVGEFSKQEGFHAKPVAQNPLGHGGLHRSTGAFHHGSDVAFRNRAVEAHEKARRKRRPLRQRFKRALLVLAIVVLTVLVGAAAWGYMHIRDMFRGGGSSVVLTGVADPKALRVEGDGRINVLLLGVSGPGHDGPSLTDTIILASINPLTYSVGILSIPRDLWIRYDSGYAKINALFEKGKYTRASKPGGSNTNREAVAAGFALLDKAVTEALGVPVHYNMLINYRGFERAVDSLGGITIRVPEQLYDETLAGDNGGSAIIAQAGEQIMDGGQALLYVRSRMTSSDFIRSVRQRQVLVAIGTKLLRGGVLSNPLKASQFVHELGNDLQTDINLNDVMDLHELLAKINPKTVMNTDLITAPHKFIVADTIAGQSVVRPLAGVGNYVSIQNYVRNIFKDSYIAKEQAHIVLIDGSGTRGKAAQLARTLNSYGYDTSMLNQPSKSVHGSTKLIDLSHGKNPYTVYYLQKRLKISQLGNKLPDEFATTAADIAIIVGKS